MDAHHIVLPLGEVQRIGREGKDLLRRRAISIVETSGSIGPPVTSACLHSSVL